jgi:hypothetical protein
VLETSTTLETSIAKAIAMVDDVDPPASLEDSTGPIFIAIKMGITIWIYRYRYSQTDISIVINGENGLDILVL